MEIEIRYPTAHSLAVVTLDEHESLRAESSAMVSMSTNVRVQTDGPMSGRGGGLFRTLKRAVLSGETFFTNTFTAAGGPGEVTLAPSLCGGMVVHDLTAGEPLLIQGGSYVAAPDSVSIDTQFQGLRGFFSGESLFFLQASGAGPVLLNAFGALEPVELNGELVVDTGHLVAFTAGVSYELGKASDGWISSFLSGEGLVLHLRGTGRVYLQTRNPAEYGRRVGSMLPPRQE